MWVNFLNAEFFNGHMESCIPQSARLHIRPVDGRMGISSQINLLIAMHLGDGSSAHPFARLGPRPSYREAVSILLIPKAQSAPLLPQGSHSTVAG